VVGWKWMDAGRMRGSMEEWMDESLDAGVDGWRYF
jgi:hypothetical protein